MVIIFDCGLHVHGHFLGGRPVPDEGARVLEDAPFVQLIETLEHHHVRHGHGGEELAVGLVPFVGRGRQNVRAVQTPPFGGKS
jgi:hypothetical protein